MKFTETEISALMHLVKSAEHMQQVVATRNDTIDLLRAIYGKLDRMEIERPQPLESVRAK